MVVTWWPTASRPVCLGPDMHQVQYNGIFGKWTILSYGSMTKKLNQFKPQFASVFTTLNSVATFLLVEINILFFKKLAHRI